MPQSDLFSAEYFADKQRKRVASMKPQDFEPWEEARARYIEKKIEPLLQTYRTSDHDWFRDFNRRKGECLHASDLIFRLQKLNPHIIVQNQINFPDWGLYIESMGRIRYLSGFGKAWLTEFSFCLTDERNLPTEHVKGWRTVLVELLCKGAITWKQVMAEFGDPKDGWNEERWMVATADIRHGGDVIFERNVANSLE